MSGIPWSKKEIQQLEKVCRAGGTPTEVANKMIAAGCKRTPASIGQRRTSMGFAKKYRKDAEIEEIDIKKSAPQITGNLKKIFELYTPRELKLLAEGGRFIPGQDKTPLIDFSGKRYRICVFADTHFGSVYFQEAMYDAMLVEANAQKVDAYVHAGDVTDGTTDKLKAQVYEQTHHGYTQQKNYAKEMLLKIKKPLYIIDGNHDRWYSGANIVQDICKDLPKAEYLGSDAGTFSVGKCSIMPWHGADGSSYATSYRVQKVIESLTGGTKPNVMFLGHCHKALYVFERHVHAISCGAMCLQSNYMRSKRLANHSGFWIVDLYLNDQGVSRVTPTFYPFYA